VIIIAHRLSSKADAKATLQYTLDFGVNSTDASANVLACQDCASLTGLEHQLRIPPLKIVFDADDRAKIMRRIDTALATGQVAQGANTAEFEQLFAEYCGTKNAIAVCNGSAAIEAALRARGVEGREVLVPTNTFFATAAAVMFAGGTVKLADIDPATFSVSLETLKRAVTSRTAGVIVVHIGGIMTSELPQIRSWCEEQGLWLLEDCAHSHGSALGNVRAGRFGYAGTYSFFATKVMTSGEGGMVVTDDDSVADKIRLLRDHGKPQPWVSYHTELGANWRMCEFAACVGIVHLGRLDEFISHRERLAAYYDAALSSHRALVPVSPSGRSSWYKYIVLLPTGADREKVRAATKERGVSFSGGVYDVPLHRQPIFNGEVAPDFPGAESACLRHVCLPLYTGMTAEDVDFVVATLVEALDRGME